MDQLRSLAEDPLDLTRLQDLSLGGVRIIPSARTVRGAAGKAVIEPRMMQVLVTLAREPGRLVTRESLLELCWRGAPVGDDSLNRAVAGLRRAFRETAGDEVRIDTVPGAGYILAVGEDNAARNEADEQDVAAAIEAGWHSWKLGLPKVDQEALDQLRRACAARPQRADAHGMRALVLRNAAEYADLDLCPSLVRECEAAASQALALNPRESRARLALIGLPPLFGDWLPRRRKLLDVLDQAPEDVIAMHDLGILEMATGRPSAAAALNDRLMELEPLAAGFHYKRTYLLWSIGRLAEMDRVADRAMQLWPRHPAIWFARFWSLAFTERPRQALQQLGDSSARPDLPAPVLATLHQTLRALADPGDEQAREAAVAANLEAAERGPAQSVAAIIQLAGLGAVNGAFKAAEGYLLRRGSISVGLHKTETDPSITDQHRRVTQMLFLPVAAGLRADPRFIRLCDEMGMAAYWNEAGLRPDFMAGVSFRAERPASLEA